MLHQWSRLIAVALRRFGKLSARMSMLAPSCSHACCKKAKVVRTSGLRPEGVETPMLPSSRFMTLLVCFLSAVIPSLRAQARLHDIVRAPIHLAVRQDSLKALRLGLSAALVLLFTGGCVMFFPLRLPWQRKGDSESNLAAEAADNAAKEADK